MPKFTKYLQSKHISRSAFTVLLHSYFLQGPSPLPPSRLFYPQLHTCSASDMHIITPRHGTTSTNGMETDASSSRALSRRDEFRKDTQMWSSSDVPIRPI